MRGSKEKIGFMPLAIGALLLSLILVLAADASRLFLKKDLASAEVHILLENLDLTTAEALLSEEAFSVNGGEMHTAVFIGELAPQPIRQITREGRIITLPSSRRFCAHLTLLVNGEITEDGFLAGGSHRLLAGSHVRIDGKKTTAEGLLLSLSFPESSERN